MALLVLLLGVAAWKQGQSEDPDFGQREFALFEGLDPRRVQSIRVDNIERSLHLGLAKDSQGMWTIVDPIAYPARRELVDSLLRAASNKAWPVPAGEQDPTITSLGSPRAVLELRELLEDGTERVHRANMGAVDLDQMRVFVQVGERTLRTMRSLEVALENDLTDWRDRQIFEVDGSTVVAISRRGFDYNGGQQVPLGLEVQRQETNWFVDRPVRVHGDPVALGAWAMRLSRIQAADFASDADPAPLERFGLNEPWFSLTLTDRRGEGQTVHFASRQGTYFCKRESQPYIWTVEGRDLAALFMDIKDLHDQSITRVFRREVEHVLMFIPDRSLRLSRAPVGKSWKIEELDAAGQWSGARPAEPLAVEAILSVLEQEQVHDYLWDQPVADYFDADNTKRRGVFVESQGRRQGGWIGEAVESENGARLFAFLRERESVVGLVGSAVHELLEIDPLQLLSSFVYTLDEVRLKALTVSSDVEQRQYARSVQGTWIYPNADPTIRVEARELRLLMDHLTHLKAESHVAGREVLTQVVQAKFLGVDGRWTEVQIGLAGDGQVRADFAGAQSVLAYPQLHAELLELLR